MSVSLQVRVNPRSSRSQIIGRHGPGIKASLLSPPAEGRANRELCQLIAKWLGVAKSSVQIRHGEHGRDKHVEIDGLTETVLQEALSSLKDV